MDNRPTAPETEADTASPSDFKDQGHWAASERPPADSAPGEEAGPQDGKAAASPLPKGPQKELRIVKQPKVASTSGPPRQNTEPGSQPIKISLNPETPVVIKLDDVEAEVGETPGVVARKGPRSISPADDERRRLFLASKLAPFQGVVRQPGSGQLHFCCPACHERSQCDASELGKVRVCAKCGAEYQLPDHEGESQIVLLHADARRAQSEEFPPMNLPDERAEEGPSNEALFQAFDELLPEGEEGVLEWGLEKKETKSEPPKRMRWWTMAATVLFVSAVGFLVHTVWQASGRTDAAAMSANDTDWIQRMEGGEINWDQVPSARLFLLADKGIRAFLNAPDLAAKAAVSRGGTKALARMQAHYDANGGYEAETRAFGDVRDIEIREEREFGRQKFIMVRVKFVRGGTAMYALLKGRNGLEVDWDYAVGYGEMSFDRWLEERPTSPVLLRGYLKESRYFNGGFVVTGYRNFDLSDSARGRSVPVYVARGSAAENALREAWRDAVIGAIDRGPITDPELDFVLKVRFENNDGRSGFVIDEVLTRGWILPDLPQ